MQVFLYIVSNFIGILPLLVYYIKYRRTKLDLNITIPILALNFFSSIYEFVFTYLLKIDSEYWFRFYLLLEFLTIVYMFWKLFEQLLYRRILLISTLIYISIYLLLLNQWVPHHNLTTDSYLTVYTTLLVYVFSILWFRKVFANFELESLIHSPVFIVISGLLLYFSSTLFLFLMSDYFLKDVHYNFLDFWQLNVVMCILFRLLLLTAILKGKKL
jgi:hypothetical protein